MVGLWLYGASMAMMVESQLGLDPWDVFHEGVAGGLRDAGGDQVGLVGIDAQVEVADAEIGGVGGDDDRLRADGAALGSAVELRADDAGAAGFGDLGAGALMDRAALPDDGFGELREVGDRVEAGHSGEADGAGDLEGESDVACRLDRRQADPSPVRDLFAERIGAVGVLTRRNALVVFMCVELMLNASNLALITFARVNGNLEGQIAAFFVMVVAAAEVVVGLAIIMTIFRTRRSASVDDASLLKY